MLALRFSPLTYFVCIATLAFASSEIDAIAADSTGTTESAPAPPAPPSAPESAPASAPAAASSAPAPAAGGLVAIEDLDIEDLLRGDVRGGDIGSYGLRLDEYGVRVVLHAFLTAELLVPVAAGSVWTFDLHHASLIVAADLFGRVRPEIALEWEHGGEEFYIPYAHVDLKAFDWLIARVGYFPVPIGAFNEYLYPDYLRKTAQAPLVLREIVPAIWAEAGLQLRGKLHWASGRGVNYALYIANGLEEKDDDPTDGMVPEGGPIRDMRKNFRDESHWDKAFGGRLGFTPREGLDVGVSGYTGAYTVDGARRLSILDADVTLAVGNLSVRLEGALALQEVTGGSLVKWGAYLLASYRVRPYLEPYVQLETIDLDGPPDTTRHRLLGGVLLRPFPAAAPSTMIKLEGSATLDAAGEVAGFAMAQVTVGF